jgi:hypothetical protein
MQENNILLVTADGRPVWPFPSVNGQQTSQSKALQADKSQHKPTPYDLSNVEEALL